MLKYMRPQSVSTLKPPFDLNLSATPPAATGGKSVEGLFVLF